MKTPEQKQRGENAATACGLAGFALVTVSLAAIWLPLAGLFLGGSLIALAYCGMMASQ